MKANQIRHTFIALFIIVILLSAGIGTMYYLTIKDFNERYTAIDQKLSVMNSKIDSTKDFLVAEIDDSEINVLNKITEEKAYSEEQRKALAEKSAENFAKLQDYVQAKTDTVKLDLESQLTDVELTIEEKSSELEDKISKIEVESADFSGIIDDVIKAVVSIQTNEAQGSGVIFNDKGYILTNKHVIDGASAIAAVDYNQQMHSVSLIGTATNADLAVLKINENKSFDFLRFEDDYDIGERVIAVGNPLGLSFTVTEGIVSAKDRQIDETGIGYIQTDVSINPGNSGGPLINSNKRVIGINTFKISATEGLGFAIPGDIAEIIAEQAVS